VSYHFTVENNPAGYARLLETYYFKLACKKDKLFFCFEHTGRYSWLLSIFLSESSIVYARVPAMDIKQSKGMTRGKSDKKDAQMIAQYASRKRDELIPTELHSPEVGQHASYYPFVISYLGTVQLIRIVLRACMTVSWKGKLSL
jgi:transposase